MIYFAGKIHSSVELWQRLLRIIAPLALPVFALICQEFLWEHIHTQKFLLFYPAVMASGWIAGKRGSFIATIFSAVAVFLFLMESNRLTSTLSHDEYIPLIVFIAIGILISHYLNVEERVITQLALQTIELEEANQARISFLAHVSHEIRTPLNAILGYAQILEMEIEEPTHKAMTQRIRNAGEYLLAILNKILDFKKIEANLLKLDLHPHDLTELLEEIQNTIAPSADAKGISFKTECSDIKGLVLSIDSLRLKQIFLNLCTNAIKFTPKGHVILRARILNDNDKQIQLLFEVQDTGIGISDEGLKVLFKPFMQAESSIASRFGGSGLGLSIVKQLVELMGGRVGVQSRLGHGTLFWLEIPFEKACIPQMQIHEVTLENNHSPKRLKGIRVLAADDNPINLDLASRLIEKEGGSIRTVTDGSQVIQLLDTSQETFDVILMDLNMPRMDGFEATRTIRSKPEWQHIPVVAYSAASVEMTKNPDAISLFEGWIEKPIRIDTAIDVLCRFCPDLVDNNENKLAITTDHPEANSLKLDQPSLLPQKTIDFDRVKALFGEDVEVFNSYLNQFQRVFRSAADDIKVAVSSGHDDAIKDLLHNLRGSAANIGIIGVAEAAKNIEEMMVKKSPEQEFNNEIADFISLLQKVLDYRPSLVDPVLEIKDEVKSVQDSELNAFAKLLAESDLEALSVSFSLQNQFKNDLGEINLRDLNYALEGLEFDEALKILSRAYGVRLEKRTHSSVKSEA